VNEWPQERNPISKLSAQKERPLKDDSGKHDPTTVFILLEQPIHIEPECDSKWKSSWNPAGHLVLLPDAAYAMD